MAVKIDSLLSNNRFWVLACGVTFSVILTGIIQYTLPAGSLQTIRLEQWFGFISILLLYFATLASPLTKVFPNLSFKESFTHARRAIGVLSFYYAFLHVYITFFKQLSGFSGLKYLGTKFSISLLFGVIAFGILCILAATSLDWAVRVMKFKNWKLLHRLVYVAVATVLLHIAIIGPHYVHQTFLGILTYFAFAALILLEILRIQLVMNEKKASTKKGAKK